MENTRVFRDYQPCGRHESATRRGRKTPLADPGGLDHSALHMLIEALWHDAYLPEQRPRSA
jgi:hypothetical protein